MALTPIGQTRNGETTLQVYVQPRAGRNRCCGIYDGALKVAVCAPPVDGKANRAVGDYLAELLNVSTRSVVLLSGAQARKKLFCLESLSVAEAQARLDEVLEKI